MPRPPGVQKPRPAGVVARGYDRPLARPAPDTGKGRRPSERTSAMRRNSIDAWTSAFFRPPHRGSLCSPSRRRSCASDVYPLTTSPQPLEVLAWVRFGPHAMQVRARAVRWTQKAVGIEFEIDGQKHRTWVWANAVDRTVPHPGQPQPVWQDSHGPRRSDPLSRAQREQHPPQPEANEKHKAKAQSTNHKARTTAALPSPKPTERRPHATGRQPAASRDAEGTPWNSATTSASCARTGS